MRGFCTILAVTVVIASAAVALPGRLQAQDGAALSLQPWPNDRHDLRRSGRTRIAGPRRALLSGHHRLSRLLPIPASIGLVSNAVVGLNGEAYVTAEWCLNVQPLIGCLGGYWYTVVALGRHGAMRFVIPDTTRQFTGTPAVGSDGTIYVNEGASTVALTPAGDVRWSSPAGTIQGVGPDGAVYVFGYTPDDIPVLRALDPLTGTVTGELELPDTPQSPVTIGLDGSIYYRVLAPMPVWGIVVALNPDGTEKWRRETGSAGESPIVGPDGSVYFAGVFDVLAWRPDGTPRWTFPINDPQGRGAGLAVAGTTVYVHTSHELAAIGGTGRVLWRRPSDGGPVVQPAVGGDGMVYSATSAEVRAFSPWGVLRWRHPIPGTPGGEASIGIGADGTLFVVGNLNGYTFAR